MLYIYLEQVDVFRGQESFGLQAIARVLSANEVRFLSSFTGPFDGFGPFS